MVVSQDETKIAAAIGKLLVKEITELEAIIIYKVNEQGKYVQEKYKEFEYRDACIQFNFN